MSECAGCSVNIWQFFDICDDLSSLCEFLAIHGVLKNTYPCRNCGIEIPLDSASCQFICHGVLEEYDYYVKKEGVSCKGTKRSARKGTWLMKGSLGVQKACQLVCFWLVLPYPRHAFIMNELQVNFAILSQWSKLCREMCQEWLLRKSVRLGGAGHNVELNQINLMSPYAGKTAEWVIGGYERETGNCFIEYVSSKDPKTIKSIVREWVLPATTLIVSRTQLPYYVGLEDEGYNFISVNCVRSFVDRDTGDHMQTLRRLWREFRSNIPNGSKSTFKKNISGDSSTTIRLRD
ncbi:hypothetical protein Pcinc_027095 [Petrolisthes cinctipes]|uniref:Transposase n=1 Tax=Petrolisthes cinctipes TaxID=88211 RepID=A0AAE1F5Q9_PETCI|nr:hypothetical protein Pcinc_027095 [Petrolisthes cinctipes]